MAGVVAQGQAGTVQYVTGNDRLDLNAVIFAAGNELLFLGTWLYKRFRMNKY